MRLAYAPTILLAPICRVGGETFDYVIAGAGTSGLVLANRLSENPDVRVGVIEPGGDEKNNPDVYDVNRFTFAFGTQIDWQYKTTPQVGLLNRTLDWHAGKAIGGTSTINGMTYVRGDKAQVDAWEEIGNEIWNWDLMYEYYKTTERLSPPTEAQAAAGATYNPANHGYNGQLTVAWPYGLQNGSFHELAQQSWEALGYSVNTEPNGGDTRGFSTWPQTLDRDANIREDSARAYWHPVEDRPNLTIIKGTAIRILWADALISDEDIVARAVEYLTPDGRTITLNASKEVILSAGALRSPLILELSGVGNPMILDKFGIETKIELPGVGEYLQEQPLMAFAYADKRNASVGSNAYANFLTAEDLFGNNTAEIAASTEAELSHWAQQIVDAHGGTLSVENVEKLFRIQHDLIFNKKVTIAETLPLATSGFLASSMWVLLPFSYGSVHLSSTEAIDSPVIDPKYYLIDFDLQVQTAVMKLSQKFWNTAPLSQFVGDVVTPEDLTSNLTNAEWESIIRNNTSPNHHPLGTASMMSRELGGVVDPKLKVHGTSNVRVVDGSILPTQISGHLTATIYAIAERAAHFIKAAA